MKIRHLCALFLVCLFVFSAVVGACRADDWIPPPPTGNDGFDWIELKSGEWLKGRIKSMQQEDLEFDSEELDIKVWDWNDIRTVRSPRLLSIRFGNDTVINGSLLVTRTEAQVVNDSGTHTFPRADLVAFSPTGSHRRDKWSIDVAVGSNLRQGNTNQISNNSHITLKRQTPLSRQRIEYLGNYGKIDGKVNKDDQRWLLNSDFLLTRRFFIRVPDVEFFHDSQQNLARRTTFGASAGYDFMQTPRTQWQVTAGPAFQRNDYDSVEAGASKSANSAAMVVGTLFDIELTKKLDFTFEYRGQFTGQKTGSNMHHTETTLEYEIHKHLTLDLSLVWDRIAKPETGSNGQTPQPDDVQLITALGVHF